MAIAIMIVVGAIGLYVADTVVEVSDLTEADVAATGTLTLTGNIVDAEDVTIQGIKFEFNASGAAATAGNVEVNTSGNLTRYFATSALTTAINNNATVSAIVSATNPTNSTVLLTADTAGSGGNAYTTTEIMSNGTWTGARLSGGADESGVAGMQSNILSAGDTGTSFVVILVIAFIGGTAIAYMFGMIGKRD